MVDLNFLENVLRYSKDALQLERIKGMDQKIWLPITNLETGLANFYCINDYDNPFELMLAGCRMPWDKRKFIIHGYPVCDGGLVCQPPVEFTQSLGATEVWVVSPHSPGHQLSPWLRGLAAPILGRCAVTRRLIKESAIKENQLRRRIEGMKDVKIICPAKPLPIDWRCTNGSLVAETIILGERAAEAFLSKETSL